MSWFSWGSDESSDAGSDDSWWGYALSAASSYADSENARKGKKDDFKNQLALLREAASLKDEYEQKAGKRLADAYAGYSQYNQPTAATSGEKINPLAALSNNKPTGLFGYAEQQRRG